jgi:hypothetical protein
MYMFIYQMAIAHLRIQSRPCPILGNTLLIYWIFLLVFPSYPHVPSGKLTQLWKIIIFNGKIHYKWPCSIAMLVITRGYIAMIFQFLPLKSPSDFRMVIGHLAMGILGPSDFPFFLAYPAWLFGT